MFVQVSPISEYVLASNTVVEVELLLVLFIRVLVISIIVIFNVYILGIILDSFRSSFSISLGNNNFKFFCVVIIFHNVHKSPERIDVSDFFVLRPVEEPNVFL